MQSPVSKESKNPARITLPPIPYHPRGPPPLAPYIPDIGEPGFPAGHGDQPQARLHTALTTCKTPFRDGALPPKETAGRVHRHPRRGLDLADASRQCPAISKIHTSPARRSRP